MPHILNFGSLNVDHVYTLDSIVKPGETVNSLMYELFPGGKGLNQSIALSLAGGRVYHAGCVSADGLWLTELLREKGVDTNLIRTDGTRTGHAVIQVGSDGQNCIIIHGGANREITGNYVEDVISQFSEGDYLVAQNEINCLGGILEGAHARGMRIALNPSPMDSTIYGLPLHKVEFFLLNEIEGCAISGEDQPEAMANRLLERYPHSRIVITLGKSGVLYKDRENMFTHGIYRTPTVDTTAAGDTFTGYFIARVAQGDPVPEALRLASLASSLAVSVKGAAVSIPSLKTVKSCNLSPA